MNTEMNPTEKSGIPSAPNANSVVIDMEGVQKMRHSLHELANVFTGVMIAGGLLSQYLGAGPLNHYATDICEGTERGCVLVREIRSQLLAACGEAEAAARGSVVGPAQGQ